MCELNQKCLIIYLATLLVIPLVSCGTECPENAIHAGGLCIIKEPSMRINIEDIEDIVSQLEIELGRRGYEFHHLKQVFEENNVKVTFTPQDTMMLTDCVQKDDGLQLCETQALGVCYENNEIYVRYFGPCIAKGALAHELLHAVENIFLDISYTEQIKHMTPWFFYEYALAHELPTDEVIEWRVEAACRERGDCCSTSCNYYAPRG